MEQKYVKEAFDTNWVVPLGPNVNGFEKDLEEFVGQNKRVVALSAGTAAVHLGLLAAGVKAGDEVIVQSFTFCASTHPVTYLGATPVLVDSEPDTWNIDPELLEKAIVDRKEKTGKYPKAIVPVALYGMPYKADRIMEIANKYGIPVVEDAAEGFGSRYKGQMLGTFGKYGVLSFNGNKMITTSGGGALITEDEEHWREIMMYATQYRESYPYYQHEKIGYNYRMSNICAGIGRGQMTVVNNHLAHHAQIEARPVWKPMHKQPCYCRGKMEDVRCKNYSVVTSETSVAYVNGVSEAIFKVGMCLPAGPYVSDDDVRYIVDTIKAAIERA